MPVQHKHQAVDYCRNPEPFPAMSGQANPLTQAQLRYDKKAQLICGLSQAEQIAQFQRARLRALETLNADPRFQYPSQATHNTAQEEGYQHRLAQLGVTKRNTCYTIHPNGGRTPAQALKRFLDLPSIELDCLSGLVVASHIAYIALYGEEKYNRFITHEQEGHIKLGPELALPFRGAAFSGLQDLEPEVQVALLRGKHLVYLRGAKEYRKYFPGQDLQGINLIKKGNKFLAFHNAAAGPQPLSYYTDLLRDALKRPLTRYDLIRIQEDDDYEVWGALCGYNGKEKMEHALGLIFSNAGAPGDRYLPTDIYAPPFVQAASLVGITDVVGVERVEEV